MGKSSVAVGIPTLDLSVRVRTASPGGECMTSDCPHPAVLSVEVSDRRSRRGRAYRACPECRSTAMLAILEAR